MNQQTYTFGHDHKAMRCRVCGTSHHFHPCPNCLGEKCEGRWRGGNTPKPIDEAKLRAMWSDPHVTAMEIADELNCSQSTVSRNAKRLELGPRPALIPKEDEAEPVFAHKPMPMAVFGRSFDEAIEDAIVREPEGHDDDEDSAVLATVLALAGGILVIGMMATMLLI
jgi:hypothetical protein